MISSKYPSWLTGFFSHENTFKLNKVLDGSYPNALNVMLLERVEATTGKTPHFLPAYIQEQYFFYCIANNRKELNELKSCIGHALGTSHTYSSSIVSFSNLNYELALLNKYPEGFLRIQQHGSKSTTGNFAINSRYISRVLNEVSDRYRVKPHFATVEKRPVGRVLRDFFTASRNNSGKLALTFFKELKASGELSHRNIIALELQALAINEKWKSVLEHEDLSDYLQGVIPERIYHLIIRAVFNEYNIDYNQPNDESNNIVQESLLGNWLSKPSLKVDERYADDWKCWCIIALNAGYENIEDLVPSFISKNWIKQISNGTALDKVIKIEVNELDKLLSNVVSPENVGQVLSFSDNCLQSDMEKIWVWLESLSFDIRQEVKSSIVFRQKWGTIEQYIYGDKPLILETEIDKKIPAPILISSWDEWFSQEKLVEFSNPDMISTWKANTFSLALINERLASVDDAEAIRNMLPHLLQWLESNETQTNSVFWLALIELLAMDDASSITTIMLLMELLNNLLKLPHSKEDYISAIEASSIVVSNELSRKSLTTIVNLTESLFEHAIKSPDTLLYQYWQPIVVYIQSNWAQLECELKPVVTWLNEQINPKSTSFLHLVNNDKEAVNNDYIVDFSGKKLGIYTLTEKAGSRASEILTLMYPGIEIETNSDKVATDALKHLAKKSDYFIFCNKSAAHQAYYAVKAISKDIIYCDGKGSSSIVKMIKDIITG